MAASSEGNSKVRIQNDVNILLLGETGVGKSTFINSFINYLQFNTFDEVSANIQNIDCLIPTKFTVIDDQFNERILYFGSNINESTAAGESATMKTKKYIFNLPNHDRKFRIIDTPGIGDTRGIHQDYMNQENIINSLSNVKYVNAICVLLKPNQARCTILFQYCINQLLICLHKIAVNNILFVFTNTSNSFFTPGETIHSLQKVLKDIEEKQNVIIPFNKENIFCVDNESFRYLLAQKSDFEIGNEKIFSKSWEHSHNEYLRMVKCAIELTPYSIDHTLYLFTVRNKFKNLSQTLIDIVDLLKNDEALLTKLQDIIDGGNPCEIDDAKDNIQEAEDRINKCKCDKNNYIVQVSKLVIFLQTNSIILLNNYSQSYIGYLIDRENSMGLSTDRKRVRQLYELKKYYEGINSIVHMDMHIDPFSPVMSREELSSVFPHLEEDVKAMYINEYNDEIPFAIMPTNSEQNYEEDSTSASTFTFTNWFKAINDVTSYITEQVEHTLDYEELRKQYVKSEYSNENSKHNVNKSFPKKYKKVHSNFDHKANNKSHFNSDFVMLSENTNSHMTTKNQSKQYHCKVAKSVNKAHTSKSSEYPESLPYKDDFVVLSNSHETNSRGNFRGRSRGRGNQGYSQQLHRLGNANKSDTKNQSHNKNRQTHKPRGASKIKCDDNRITNNPNNILQSMKTLFD